MKRETKVAWSFSGKEEGKTLRVEFDRASGELELTIDFHGNGTAESVTLSKERAIRLVWKLMRETKEDSSGKE